MSDESAFLAAIAADPADDTARLVYADWLQERGDPRAEYLRLEVRRHRMTARERRKDDPFYQLERLRPHATADWLSRIDRTMRLSMFWPQQECASAEREGLVGKPLARVHSRGNHNTRFPKSTEAGNYLYVFAFCDRTLFLVARMRVEHLVAATTVVIGVAGTEGTPVRFDLLVSDEALKRLSWFSGKKEERSLRLDVEGRLTSATSLHSVLRITPRTAADLDAILRGESLS